MLRIRGGAGLDGLRSLVKRGENMDHNKPARTVSWVTQAEGGKVVVMGKPQVLPQLRGLWSVVYCRSILQEDAPQGCLDGMSPIASHAGGIGQWIRYRKV